MSRDWDVENRSCLYEGSTDDYPEPIAAVADVEDVFGYVITEGLELTLRASLMRPTQYLFASLFDSHDENLAAFRGLGGGAGGCGGTARPKSFAAS